MSLLKSKTHYGSYLICCSICFISHYASVKIMYAYILHACMSINYYFFISLAICING